jgi:hypothetical protein
MNFNDIKILDNTSVVALYGSDMAKSDLQEVYKCALAWFATFGLEPDLMGFNYNNEVTGGTGRLRAFDTRHKKLMALGFDHLTGLDLKFCDPNSDIDDFVVFSFSEKVTTLESRFATCQIPDGSLMPITLKMMQLINPEYAIGYTRHHTLAPGFFASGIGSGENYNQTLQEYEADRNRSFWLDTGMGEKVWRTGLIRDVFQWNFLSDTQLERPVDGMCLREWIATSPNRGTLVPTEAGLTFWNVEEAMIPSLSKMLMKSGNCFHWRVWHNMPIETDPNVGEQYAHDRAAGLWID